MDVQDCFMELICHSRWIASYLLRTQDDPRQQRYSADLDSTILALDAVSKTFSHIDSISDVPNEIICMLCDGVVYLLVAEDVLHHCPPTMHQFLKHTSMQRHQSAKQALLLAVRWFVNSGVVSLDDLFHVVFGENTTVASFNSDYDAHMALATNLAKQDPFFLGAHLVMLRGLLLQYSLSVVSAEAIVSHTHLLDSQASGELYTLEDTLLFWIRVVVSLTGGKPKGLPQIQLDDLYLHTNDGRVLSLLLHHYRPDLLSCDSIHLESPLTVWQRQDNWSLIIRAAEHFSIWVGVFADEMVSHGFSTLQLHVLRIVVELFTVLAAGAEQSYDEMARNITIMSSEMDAETAFLPNHREPKGVDWTPTSRKEEVSIQNSTDYVSVTPRIVQDVFLDASTSMHHRKDAADTSAADSPQSDSPKVGRETLELVSVQQPAVEKDDDGEEDIGEKDQGGEYNIILTNMFLQGVSVPIHRIPTPMVQHPVDEDTRPVERILTLDESEHYQTQDMSTFIVHHNHSHNIKDEKIPEDPPLILPEVAVGTPVKKMESENETVPVVDSPQVPRRSSKEALAGGAMNRSSSRNPLALSVDHFKRQLPTSDSHRTSIVVQGNVDSDGTEELLSDLRRLALRPVSGSCDVGSLREQNEKLHAALVEQKASIARLVERFQDSLPQRQFDAVQSHLRKIHRADTITIGVGTSFAFAAGALKDALIPKVNVSRSFGSNSVLPAALQIANLRDGVRNTSPVAHSPALTESAVLVVCRAKERATEDEKKQKAMAFDVSITGLKKPVPPPAPKINPHLPQRKKNDPIMIPQLAQLRERTNNPHGHNPSTTGYEPPGQLEQPPPRSTSSLPPILIRSKSNRSNTINALKHALLPGLINQTALSNALKIVGVMSDDTQFVALLKDEFSHQFRGLYALHAEKNLLTRIFGVGPQHAYVGDQSGESVIRDDIPTSALGMFPKYFKFDTGSKRFHPLPSKSINQQSDGIAFGKVKVT